MELNNREWAIVIWVFIVLVILGFNSRFYETRLALKNVLKILISRPILIVITLMIGYVSALIIGLYQVRLWEWSQSKNTLIWLVSVGWLSLFNLEKYRKNQYFYKEFCFSNFKLLAVIHFILAIYTCSLWTELVLVPVLVFLAALLAVAQTKKNYQKVEKLITNIFGVYGIGLVSYTLYMVINDFDSFANKATFNDFLIPSLLTILYLPFVYLMLVYSTYERGFIRLQRAISQPELLRYAKFYALKSFHFRYGLLDRWIKSLVYISINTNADVKGSVDEIFSRVRIEKNPPAIKTNRGWSPYEAMNFLKNEGLVAEDYHLTYSEEWVARSEYVKTREDRDFRNTVIYRVNGNATIADCLELDFSMNSLDSLTVGHGQLLFYAKALVSKSLDRDMPEDIKQAIMHGVSSVFKIGIYEVELKKEEWGNKSLGGYDLEFSIRLSK